VVGENHPSAEAAVEALNNYRELLDELQLRVTVDGPTRVGHTRPFGVFISLEHTRQLGRESGGFAKYLENLAAQRAGYNPYLYRAGQSPINYRDEFTKNIHAALDETFEVASITFHDPSVPMIDLPREGWQETPLAYAVLRAKDAAVDRIPSIQLDMDFADTSGQVVLPVRSQVQPIDAKDADPPLRPCEELALTFIMDEREWRDGRVVVEIAAKARGIIPSHLEMFDFERPGFDVEVTDNGLSVSQLEGNGRQTIARADRGWQFTYQRKKDLRGDVVFPFPALKPGIETETVEYKHYQDADLVTVDARQALAGVPLSGRVSSTLRNVLVALAVLAVGFGIYGFVRLRHRRQPQATEALTIPAQITPFSVVAFLQRIEREHALNLNTTAREGLKSQIREIESAFFSHAPSNGAPDLEAVARKWLQAVS
jgi:hypothetical protein